MIHGVLHLCGIDDKGPGEGGNGAAENRALGNVVKNRLDNEEKIFHADCSVAPFGSGNRCFRTEQNDGDRVPFAG